MAFTLFIVLVLATLLVQGFLEPYRLVTEKIEGPLPGLPESWEGARVVLLADFQVGLWLDNRATVQRAVRRAVALRPAFVLLAGDLIHDTERGIAPVIELLRPLTRAGVPTYAVLGNHDYAMPTANYPENRPLAERLEAALQEIGIPVLHNESVALRNERGDTLYLVGIGSHVPQDDDPPAALSGVPEGAPRLVMMHHPNSYPALPAHSAPLAVAAHTHGGQVRLPLAPAWSLLTWFRERKVYNSDWARGYGREGNRLYVTRGIGCSVAPIRLNCPPELTLITLRRPEAAEDMPDPDSSTAPEQLLRSS